jgi:hypothetical protein
MLFTFYNILSNKSSIHILFVCLLPQIPHAKHQLQYGCYYLCIFFITVMHIILTSIKFYTQYMKCLMSQEKGLH